MSVATPTGSISVWLLYVHTCFAGVILQIGVCSVIVRCWLRPWSKTSELQHTCVVVVAVIVALWLKVDGSVAVAFNIEGGMPTCVMALRKSLAVPMSSMRASRRGH